MKTTIGQSTRSVLHPDLESGVHLLRGALAEMLSSVGTDTRRPQELSRRLKLDKSLAWKVSKVVTAGEPQVALQHLPGEAAMELVVKAAGNAGGSKDLCQRVEEAAQSLRDAVARHLGDKPTMDLVIDAMPSEKGERLVASRRLAFRGNSAIWGVQAKTRINTIFLAPNPERPEMIDIAALGGWLDFRRLRHDAQWVLFRRGTFTTHRGPAPREEPLDPEADPAGPMFIRDFCSPVLPTIHAVPEEGVVNYELGESTIGNSGAFSAVYGSLTRAIGTRFAEQPTDIGFFQCGVSAPVEHLQFDLLVHRDLPFALNMSVTVEGRLAAITGPAKPRDRLPIDVARVELGRFPPVVESSAMPRYGELTNWVYQRLNWKREEFVGVRYTVEFPPFPSTVVVSFPLEKR